MAGMQLQPLAKTGVGQPRLRLVVNRLVAPGPLAVAVAAVATPSAMLVFSSWGGHITTELLGHWVMISLGAMAATGAIVLMLPSLFGAGPAPGGSPPTPLAMDAERLEHLSILGVGPNAEEDEIQRRYRVLARACHPDLHPENIQAEAEFKRLNQARTALLG